MDASQLLRRALASQQQPHSSEDETPSFIAGNSLSTQGAELTAMKARLSASVDELSISGHKHLLTKVALLRKKMREFAVAVEGDDRSNIPPHEQRDSVEREADQERELLLSYILDDKKKATTLNEELQKASYDLQLANSKLRQVGHKLGVLEDLYVKEKASGAKLRDALEKAQGSFEETQNLKYQLEVSSIDRDSLQQQVQELIDKTNNLEYEIREREKHSEDIPALRNELRARDHELGLVKAERAEWRKERLQLMLQGDQLRNADALLSELNLSLAAYSKTAALQPPYAWADMPQLQQASPLLQQRVQDMLGDLRGAQQECSQVLQENVLLCSELQAVRDTYTEEVESVRNSLRASQAAEAEASRLAEAAAQQLLASGLNEDAPFLLERAAELMAAYESGAAGDVALHTRNQKVIAGLRTVLDNWKALNPSPQGGSRPLHLLSSGKSSDESTFLRMNVLEATNLAEKQNRLTSVLEERLQQLLLELRARDTELAALRSADMDTRRAIERVVEAKLRDGSLRFSSLPPDFKQLSMQRQLETLLRPEGSKAYDEGSKAYRSRVREISENMQLSRIGSPDKHQASWGSFSFDALSPTVSPTRSVRPGSPASPTTPQPRWGTAAAGPGLLRAKASLSALKEV